MTFQTRTLREISTIVMGLSPKGTDVSLDSRTGLPLLNGPTEFSSVSPVPRQWTTKWSREAHKNDILFCVRGSTTGRTNLADQTFAIGRGIAAIRGATDADTSFIHYSIKHGINRLLSQTSGSVFPNLSAGDLKSFSIEWPDSPTRKSIATILGTLDDKIESNRKLRNLLRSLGRAYFDRALGSSGVATRLDQLTTSIARGVTPKYADDDAKAPIVVNQKCIRDGWVSLVPARRMRHREVAPVKRASSGDILVNSTGTGTLGRVARWHDGDVFVDSHVTVVKPDTITVEAILVAYALLTREVDIEDLATGSTGQTELSSSRLGSLEISIPNGNQRELIRLLISIEDRADNLATEIERLKSLRDTLCPELLSGRIRVPGDEVAI